MKFATALLLATSSVQAVRQSTQTKKKSYVEIDLTKVEYEPERDTFNSV